MAEVGQFLLIVGEVKLTGFLKHFIIRDVAYGSAIVVNSIAETFPGVAEEFGFYANTVDLESLFFKVAKINPRAKFAQGDREIDSFHLRRDELTHGGIALVRTKYLELISRHIERGEEGDCVDMIPVGVRDENASEKRWPLVAWFQ